MNNAARQKTMVSMGQQETNEYYVRDE